MLSIAVALIINNEERCIERCIDSLLGIFDEYIFIDNDSTDKTVSIIQSKFRHAALDFKVVHSSEVGSFSVLRNLAIENVSCDGVFFIDADEMLTSGKESIYTIYSDALVSGLSEKIAFCPMIENHDGNVITSIPRGFFLSGNYEYIGYVHEGLRKKDSSSFIHKRLGIKILHDGYREDIINDKNKLYRNLPLNEKNLKLEPGNQRWVYFYARDGFDILNKNTLYFLLKDNIKIEPSRPLCNSNIIKSAYSFKIIDLMIRIYLSKLELAPIAEFNELINLLDALSEANSNSIYYIYLFRLIRWKKEALSILHKIAEFQQSEVTNHSGMLHSQGFHIDSLMGAYLHEVGLKKTGIDIFKSLDENGYNDFLTKEYFEK
jgi:glycosyltransferase involved in cell wall biosynthesis